MTLTFFCGIALDKWDLSEGNDTYAFMEKCATDTSITNVLMLLDPVYAQKADDHSGGVGTETQIISHQVYREVEQDKFIPIVFERNDKGEICKPTYFQGRLHFDLTHDEKYDSEYYNTIRVNSFNPHGLPPAKLRAAYTDDLAA